MSDKALPSLLDARNRAARIVRACDDMATEDGVPRIVLDPIYEYAETLAKCPAKAAGLADCPACEEPCDGQ